MHIKKKSGVMKTSVKKDVDSVDGYTPAPYPLVYSGYSQNRRVLESTRGEDAGVYKFTRVYILLVDMDGVVLIDVLQG